MRASVKSDLPFEFTDSRLTSYAGLDLLRSYLRANGLDRLLRRHLDPSLARDFGAAPIVRMVLALLVVGGRRLRHLAFLQGDPMILRFAGVKTLPPPRTFSRWLQRFRGGPIEQLRRANAEVVATTIATYLALRTLTIDVDGTALLTGLTVERPFRGRNPHHRKVPTYLPITSHLAETGHVLRVQNRSGNINDGKASLNRMSMEPLPWRQTTSACRVRPVQWRNTRTVPDESVPAPAGPAP